MVCLDRVFEVKKNPLILLEWAEINEKQMKVLIDNGHGENTAGKRSPDGRLLVLIPLLKQQSIQDGIQN